MEIFIILVFSITVWCFNVFDVELMNMILIVLKHLQYKLFHISSKLFNKWTPAS